MVVPAPLPDNEEQRLEWLRHCNILDVLPEVAFDEITRLAAEVCRVPVAAINLVDKDRQWTLSSIGKKTKEDRRDISFCAHTILEPDLMVVADAWGDHRFADNPLVTGDPHIRFYAGAPLRTPEGFGIGSLCVIDSVPRELTGEQGVALRLLSHQVTWQIEMRRHVLLQEQLMTDRGRLLEEAQQSARRERAFLKDVLWSVTGGHLRLLDGRDDLPPPMGTCGDWTPLIDPSEMRWLRLLTRERGTQNAFPEARIQDLITAVSEAAMNAIVHGGGGQARVCGTVNTVQVWIEDYGHGIDVSHLPKATLERGYTTAGSLGHGMKLMLDTVDRVFLLTGPSGTTVVMEQDREPPMPAWLL